MSDTIAPVWFITGCSTGFGREIAEQVIAKGWRAVVSARDLGRVADLTKGAEDRVLALTLDVTDQAQIEAAVAAAQARFGRIDVLVNNAGYGYLSSAEEGEEDRIRALFEVNVFGLFAMTRAVLPVMRAQRSGHVLNISSMSGLSGSPLSGYYCASKHAVEGFSKAAALELAPFGVKVTCIEPSSFRTDFHDRSIQLTPPAIDDYVEAFGARVEMLKSLPGRQAGDPVRAAEAMIAVTQEAAPPLNLLLGKQSFDYVTAHLHDQLEQIEARREIAVNADFPAG